MRKILYALAGALALLCLADEHRAFAQNAIPVGARTKETLSCPSPCTVSANNTAIFADTTTKSRVKWACRNVGANDAYLCLGSATCSSAAYDVILTTAGKDSYTEDSGVVTSGPITAASAGATLACYGWNR